MGDAIPSRPLCPTDISPVIGGNPDRLGPAVEVLQWPRKRGNPASLPPRAYPCVRFAGTPFNSPSERGRRR